MLSLIFHGFICVFFSVLLSVQSSVLLSSEECFCVKFSSVHIYQHFLLFGRNCRLAELKNVI